MFIIDETIFGCCFRGPTNLKYFVFNIVFLNGIITYHIKIMRESNKYVNFFTFLLKFSRFYGKFDKRKQLKCWSSQSRKVFSFHESLLAGAVSFNPQPYASQVRPPFLSLRRAHFVFLIIILDNFEIERLAQKWNTLLVIDFSSSNR